MADYYIDAQNGDDANDGLTPSTPIQTLNEGFNLRLYGYNDDDTIHLSGMFTGDLGTASEAIIKVLTPGQRVTIKQWAGMPQAVIRNDVVIPNGSWTYGGSAGVFTFTFAGGYFDTASGNTLPEAIASVVVNWDTIVDADGYHSGHLRRAQSSADCDTRVNSWWFSRTGAEGSPTGTQTGGGVLKINIGNTDDSINSALTSTAALTSAGLTIAYCRGNRNGVEVGCPTYQDNVFTLADFATINPSGTRNLKVDGLHVYLFCDSGWRTRLNGLSAGIDVGPSGTVGTRSIGYGIRVADGLNCVVQNCTVIDSGYHGIMFVGDLCRDNLMYNCSCYGSGLNPTSGNSLGGAFYTGASGPGNKNIEGCVGRNVTLYKYTHLGRTLETVSGSIYAIPNQFPFNAAGAAAYTTCTSDGFICHTNEAADNDVLDVSYHWCLVIERGKKSDNSMCLGSAMIGGSSGPASLPSDGMNAAHYPVRFFDCEIRNACYNSTSGECSVAYVRCKIELARAGAQRGSSTGVLCSASGTHAILFDACTIIVNLDHASGARNLFQCSLTNKVYLKNTSVFAKGSGSNTRALFNFLSGALGSYVKARGCIFGYASTTGANNFFITMGVTPDTTVLNNTNFDMDDCWYFRFSSTWTVGGFPGPTETAWRTTWDTAGMDPNGVYGGTTNPYLNGDAATDLSPTEAAKATRKSLPIRSDLGINLLRYSGNYGAWQYGGSARRAHSLGIGIGVS